MTVVDLLRLIRRHVVLIVIGALLGLALAAAYMFTRPTEYVAQSTGVVVAGDSIVGSNVQDLSNSTTMQRAQMYAALSPSAAVADRARKELADDGKAAAGNGSFTATTDPTSPFIRITATGSTAARAQDLANAALLAIRSEALRLETFGQTKGSTSFTDRQLEDKTSIHVLPYAPAQLPGAPVRPHLYRNLAIGLVGGALLALGLAALRSSFDSRVRRQEDVEELTGVPALAAVPDSKELQRRGAVSNVGGSAGEALRQLRTNLRFVSVDSPPKAIVITSPAPGDGKSTVSAYLARLMAAAGQDVILVDCDLRVPTQDAHFGVDGHIGLTQVVAGEAELKDALCDTNMPNLKLLPAGRVPPNPSELLGSRTMHALVLDLCRDHVVILDAPPVLAVTDAALVGSLADGVILVTRMGSAHKAQLVHATRVLEQVNATLLGTVLNRVNARNFNDGAYGYRTSYTQRKKYEGYYVQAETVQAAAGEESRGARRKQRDVARRVSKP